MIEMSETSTTHVQTSSGDVNIMNINYDAPDSAFVKTFVSSAIQHLMFECNSIGELTS